MARRNPTAGGFFLILFLFAGLAWGTMSGMPLFGALVGTAAGIIVALVVWLVDRRKGA